MNASGGDADDEKQMIIIMIIIIITTRTSSSTTKAKTRRSSGCRRKRRRQNMAEIGSVDTTFVVINFSVHALEFESAFSLLYSTQHRTLGVYIQIRLIPHSHTHILHFT